MPRSSLPQSLKSLRVFDDIEITKHTEDDVWDFYKGFCDSFDSKVDYYRSVLEEAGAEFFEGNPFSNRSINAWRNNRVQLTWKDNSVDWVLNLGESKLEDYHKLQGLHQDLLKCNKELHWDTDDTKKDYYYEWINKAENFVPIIRDKVEEIKLYETLRYNEEKKKYQENDKHYITEKKLRDEHRFHHSKEYYEELFATDPEEVKFYTLKGMPNEWETCNFCIAEKEQSKLREIQQKESEEAQARRDEDFIRHLLEVQAEERKKWLDTRKEYFCELCNYKSYSPSNYEAHCNTREHQKKKHNTEWICKTCNFFARSDNEMKYHNLSKKHLKAVGDIVEDPIETFECKKCNYTTTRKDHYTLHLKTKKHQDNCSS